MAEDFMKLIDDEFDRGINPKRIEIDINKLNLTPEEHDKAIKYIQFKREHFSHNKKIKKNFTGIALAVFFILFVSGIFSTGIFLSFTQQSEVEMFAPEFEESVDLREFNAEPLTKAGISLVMDVGMTREFFYENKKYSLELLASGKNYADLKISVNNTIFSVFQGREAKLDLDSDGEEDISIMLLYTEYQKANMRAKVIDKVLLKQMEEAKRIACNDDDECNDGNIETYDVCDSETKFCVNAETVVCQYNDDCEESDNYTVRCIKKSGKLPYCEYSLPDQCTEDSDCDDEDFTTEDTCIILPTSTNYCQYDLTEKIDCGKTVDRFLDNTTEKNSDEAADCFKQYLSSDFDLEMSFYWNESRIDVEILRLKNNKSNLFVEFEKTPYSFKEYKDKYIECEFKDQELINLSKATSSAAIDADEFMENFLVLLENPSSLADNDCVGNLNSPPVVLAIPEINTSIGLLWVNIDEYISDDHDILKDLILELSDYDEDKVDLEFADDNKKLKVLAKNISVENPKLVVTDSFGSSTAKTFKITIN